MKYKYALARGQEDEQLAKLEPGQWYIFSITTRPHNKALYDYDYQKLEGKPTYSQVLKGEAVRLYRNERTFVHKEEREHALTHWYFCRIINCKYHTSY